MTDLSIKITHWLQNPAIAQIGAFIIAIIASIVGVRVFQYVTSRSIKNVSTRYKVRKFIGFLGYFIVIMILLSTFSDRLGQLTVIFGVAGAGIAFALQEVIASAAGWIAVSFGSFYQPGDRVQLGGIKGDVIDIGVLRTTVMEIGDWVAGDNYNGRIVRIANSFVFKEPVYNYSGEFAFLWDEFKIPVRFGSDWKLAHSLIEGAVTEHTNQFIESSTEQWQQMVRKFLIEEARIKPMITLAITDNWIEFNARYVVNFRQRRSTKDAIMRSILESFEKHKKKVLFASTTVELVSVPKKTKVS